MDACNSIEELERSMTGSDADLPVLTKLASLYWASQRLEDAARALDRILAIQPANAHAWNGRALCLSAIGRAEEAILCFRKAVEHEPKLAAFHQNLALTLARSGRYVEAAESYRQCLQLDPGSQTCLSGLAEACSNLGRSEEQLESLERLSALRPLSKEERLIRAEAFFRLGRIQPAMEEVDAVVVADGGHKGALFLRALIRQQQGRHAEAADDLKRAIDLEPGFAAAYWYLTQSMKFTEADRPVLEQMSRAATSANANEVDRGVIQFAIGSAHNDLGEYEQAMGAFESGNRIMHSQSTDPFSPAAFTRYIDDLIALFGDNVLARGDLAASPSELPIFIVGMPRSGTTLTETILASHPEVVAGGELPFWPSESRTLIDSQLKQVDWTSAARSAERYLQDLDRIGPGAARVTDKQPYNFLHVGLLRMLFPSARFVHCRRNPVDTCLSLFMTTFSNPPSFAHDRANIVAAYRQYARLMAHWRRMLPSDRLLEIDYEELVTNQERVSRKLLGFCGLDWDEACLHPERHERLVTTMSHWQSRQPVYRTSVERWRLYEPWLGEFRSLLDEPLEA